MSYLQDPSSKYRPFAPVHYRERSWPDNVISQAPRWCSVDLRDGNQALIEPMDPARKLRMFDLLLRLGFKEIEVGFPSASQTDFDFVRSLIDGGRIPPDVAIQVLTPAREPLIRRTFEALKGARRVILHFYNATAPVMRKLVFGMPRQQIIDELAVRHAALIRDLAREYPDTEWVFEYSPEMFSNTELDFALEAVNAVTEVWQPTAARPCIINLPATVECSTPNIFADMVEWMHRNLARRDGIILSIHPHNDRGTGVAAAEFALMAGADRIEGCLLGNGERTGNVDVVNLALNLYTQGVAPGLNFADIDELRQTVEYCNQLPVHPRHPYVGDLVYTSFSGSHQDAIKKAFSARKPADVWDMPYLPIDPMDLGRSYDAVIRVNSQSGKGGISYLLEHEYGLSLPRRLQIEFSQVVQRVTDTSGKEVTAADIWAIFSAEYFEATTPYAYQGHQFAEDSADDNVSLGVVLSRNGETLRLSAQGNGPIDAFIRAVAGELGDSISVVDYTEHSLGAGADASAVAYVELRLGSDRALFGVGRDANIVKASLKAILCGVNRALRARAQGGTPG